MGLNKSQLIGNLGQDPEERGQNGNVCRLRIAITERVKRDGEWEDHTEWVNVVCFGKTAENCLQYLSKGREVYVEGKMRTTSYEDRNGDQRWSTEVNADKVLFLGGGGGDRDGGGRRRGGGGGSRGRNGGGGRDRNRQGSGGGGGNRGNRGRGGNGNRGGGGGNRGGGNRGGGGGDGGYGGDDGFYDDDLPF